MSAASIKNNLSGAIAFVAGCGNDMTRAIATELWLSGATVAIGASDLRKAMEVTDSVRRHGGRALAFELDVNDTKSIDHCLRKTVALLSGIHILVNILAAPSTNTEELDGIGVICGLRRTIFGVAPRFRAQKSGRIVTICSPGHDKLLSSEMSGAVIALTQSLAVDLGIDEININAVCASSVVDESDIAKAAVFLISDYAANVTGQSLRIPAIL